MGPFLLEAPALALRAEALFVASIQIGIRFGTRNWLLLFRVPQPQGRVQVRAGVHWQLEHRLGVVLGVDLEVVDDGGERVDPEGVVGDVLADRVLEVDVKLVHAGRVVHLGHDLVARDARLLLDPSDGC